MTASQKWTEYALAKQAGAPQSALSELRWAWEDSRANEAHASHIENQSEFDAMLERDCNPAI